MTKDDAPRFAELMTGLAIAFEKQVEKARIAVYWRALEKYPIASVECAIDRHIATSKFFPAAAEIIELINDEIGSAHIGAEEAWAIAVRMLDEDETVVVTDEIRRAWAEAGEIMALGDEVGARMAFKEIYNRLDKSQPPKWNISPGNRIDLRHQRVADAVSLGRLPVSALNVYPAITAPNMAALTHGLSEHLRLASADGEVVCEIEKAKRNLSNIQAMLSGKYAPIEATSDDRVTQSKADKEARLKRALGGE
jgi:hypothetical protein